VPCLHLARNGPSKFCGEGLMLRAERTWRGRCLRVTRVTPLTFYREWMVQLLTRGRGRRFMVALAAPLPGATYAGVRWSTLAYVEKVRSQFLSLRQVDRTRVFSARSYWQISPVEAAISDRSSSLRIGKVGLFFSERLASLQTSGLHCVRTVLEIRTFRAT
jgi:hypothetical protein